MIETGTSWVTLINEDTLRIEFKPDCYVDLKEYEENLQAYQRLMKTEKVFVLTIANAGAETSPEVRKVFLTPERSSFKIAEAFVISSLAKRIVASFVVRVQKPTHPVKLFDAEKEALEWLNEQKLKTQGGNQETELTR